MPVSSSRVTNRRPASRNGATPSHRQEATAQPSLPLVAPSPQPHNGRGRRPHADGAAARPAEDETLAEATAEPGGASAPPQDGAFSRGRSRYTAADIAVLEGIQAIRHRPGMYIGSTSASGLIHLLWEALDNAVDEAVAGFGRQIWVSVDRDSVVAVRDEGRGMPFDEMTYAGRKLPAATVLLTVPHSGGKFAEGAYRTAGGLHGVGATVINALSEWLELDVWRDGQHFWQRFERGAARPPKV